MSPAVVTALAAIAAIVWLAFVGVAALRSRGPEEIPANLSPGITDDVLETTRLERTQVAAVILSFFLAVGIPLYYLFEPSRQEGFVEQFSEESITRGDHLVAELQCFGCHGPAGVGGAAAYTEKRTGASVLWVAPPLDNVLTRYDRDAVIYWVTYGRGNSPMPAWGTPGGGPLTDKQVVDIVNYLTSIQIDQVATAIQVEPAISAAKDSLARAEESLASSILIQRQAIVNIENSPTRKDISRDIAKRARAVLDAARVGIDTDGDGLSDTTETEINHITAEARDSMLLPGLEDRKFDPANPATNGSPDGEAVAELLATLRTLARDQAPILVVSAEKIENALSQPGDDGDGDGVTDAAESLVSAVVVEAQSAVLPAGFVLSALDPTKPESQPGTSDRAAASRAVSALETIALNFEINTDNQDRILGAAKVTLEALLDAQREKRWEFDFEAIARRSFDGDVDKAERAVGIFNAYCARCHTSGWSAGAAFSQEAGSGGFGPALWDGRPAIQFLSDEELASFLVVGAELNKPYGVNGFGSGRMPAFGKILSEEDLLDLAVWLRSGDLTGKGAR